MYDFNSFVKADINEIRKLNPNINIEDLPINDIRDSLYATIYRNVFGVFMNVDTESSGLGYITYLLRDDINLGPLAGLLPPEIDIKEFINAYIRVMGDNFRYYDHDSPFDTVRWQDYNSLSVKFKKHIRKLSKLFDLNEIVVGQALYEVIHQIFGNDNFIIMPNSLSFRTVNSDAGYYECNNCRRIHLHKGMGICTNTQCLEKLPDEATDKVNELRKNNFISFDILTEPRKPKRLHTEELTGQTDDQAKRQLEFKGVFAEDEKKVRLTREIDMINVTTTMEVGVDIGSLEAIYQGNMPPTRYNYQQRVGRGGRRGQSYSAALTFCRGKSHDSYYYHSALDEITGGDNPPPTLSIAPSGSEGEKMIKPSIVKRIITKHILNLAFAETEHQNSIVSDNHGEFGTVNDWQNIRNDITSWIEENTEKTFTIIDYYLSQFNENEKITQQIDELKTWLQHHMLAGIDKAVNSNPQTEGLAQALAEYGLLPMYGMPSDGRVFYHGAGDGVNAEIRTISRSSEQAITEFAPGSIKTKDHGQYAAMGLTVPLQWGKTGFNKSGVKTMIGFDDNAHLLNALQYSYTLEKDDNGNIASIENGWKQETEDQTNKKIRIVIPKAYRTAKIEGNYGSQSDNTDSLSNFTTSRIWARENGSKKTKDPTDNNYKLTFYEQSDTDYPEVWSINDNNGNLFKGHAVQNFKTYDNNRNGDNQCNGWVNTSIKKATNQNLTPNFIIAQEVCGNNNDHNTHEIALGARKTTEILKIEIKKVPDEINLISENGYAPAIQSAFYSAAFIFQRVLADKLDIEPNEIQISELKIDSDSNLPHIFLSDQAPNGSGFVEYLFEHFDSILTEIMDGSNKFISTLISDAHTKECLTSCQKCLNTYNNAAFHHILDWRLGLGLLRLIQNPGYKFGIDGDIEYDDVKDIVKIMNQAIETFAAVDTNSTVIQGNRGINFLQFNNDKHFGVTQRKNKMIIHPLWSIEYLRNNQDNFVNEKIDEYLNLFEVLRTIKS